MLVILDGWGLSSSWAGNAIAMNNPPNFSSYWREYPHKVLQAYAQEGGKNTPITDSRYAHATIAAGRNVPQDREIIDQTIVDNSFYRNKVLLEAIDYAKKKASNLHLIGLISDGVIHSKIEHLIAIIELAHRQNFSRVYLDIITDGINTGPMTAMSFIGKVQRKIAEGDVGQFASVVGRSFAMPQGSDIKSISRVREMLIESKADHTETIQDAIKRAYQKGLNDAKISPTLINTSEGIVNIKNNDALIFFNFRSEPIKKLVRALIEPTLASLFVTTFTRYFRKLNTQVAFPRAPLSDILPEVLAKFQKTDLRISESVKKPQITTFFNGFRTEPYACEEDWIIPSVETPNFNQIPAMRGKEIVRAAQDAIRQGKYDFILINFPNTDTIAHTGNILATGQAVRAVDGFLKSIVDAALQTGGAVCVSADHGIAEEIKPKTGSHSLNPVPFILISRERKRDLIHGALAIPASTLSKMIGIKESIIDIAPTILELMNLPKPASMSGHSLLNKLD